MKYTDHYFRVEIAARHGIDVAIFVRDIYAWCTKNRDNEDAFHAGRYWTYNKMSAFCKRHPYWSKRQLERIIAASKEAGLILIDRFNKDPMDRTNWYAVTDYALSFYEDNSVSGKCEAPNGEMQTTERYQTKHQTGKCIYKEENTEEKNAEVSPYSPPEGDGAASDPEPVDKPAPADKPVPKSRTRRTRQKKSVPTHAPERFEQFWAIYPGGGSRLKAVEAWDALAPSDELIDEMARALKAQMRSRRWRDGIGIPYASTWLNQKRWTDKLPEEPQAREASGCSWSDAPD